MPGGRDAQRRQQRCLRELGPFLGFPGPTHSGSTTDGAAVPNQSSRCPAALTVEAGLDFGMK
jgi:hypothetical protein